MILYLESANSSAAAEENSREAKLVEKVVKPEPKDKNRGSQNANRQAGDKNSREESRSRRRGKKTGNEPLRNRKSRARLGAPR